MSTIDVLAAQTDLALLVPMQQCQVKLGARNGQYATPAYVDADNAKIAAEFGAS